MHCCNQQLASHNKQLKYSSLRTIILYFEKGYTIYDKKKQIALVHKGKYKQRCIDSHVEFYRKTKLSGSELANQMWQDILPNPRPLQGSFQRYFIPAFDAPRLNSSIQCKQNWHGPFISSLQLFQEAKIPTVCRYMFSASRKESVWSGDLTIFDVYPINSGKPWSWLKTGELILRTPVRIIIVCCKFHGQMEPLSIRYVAWTHS